MSNAQENRFVRLWDSNDLVSRVFRCDELRSAELPEPTAPHEVFDARAKSPLEVSLNTPSLTLIAADAERHESLSVRRSAKISERHLQGFGARNMSTWALDALADRASGGLHDWASLRSVAVRFDENPVGFDAALDRIKIGDIWRIVELIHARTMDTDAERGLLRFLAARVIAGAKFSDGDLESLIENLLNADLGDEARALFPRLTKDTWIRHAFAIDLEHPRFGGSFDAVLGTLNQAYRRFGLETVSLDGDGATPFAQVTAVGTGAAPQGPLVTIIMTSWSPKPEIFTAVRSLIGQTYCNWELLVADDASDPEYGPILDRVEALDPRIRVIRNAENAGTYVRRNEAIKQARGEFVTVQDSDDWSHPRRLEIQVRDLLASPGRYANVVRAARTTEDLSLVSPRGARLFVSEPSIMFRREAVLEAAGYFDTTRKGADTEFRQRLEIATGTPVAVVGPEAPLELMLADKSSLSGGDFGKSLWTSAARVAYRSSIRRYQTRLRSGEVSGRFDFPQVIRALTAPSQLLYGEDASVDVDVLIIVDAHGTPARHWFIDGVADEIALAEASGMKVALLHSDSATGVKNAGPISEVLQAMIDDHRLVRVLAEDDVRADLVVVRHAGAAQGHVAVRRPIQAKRAVVVEDRAGDDRRGITIAKRDVVDTVRAWLDLEPEWMLAENTPSRPQFLSGVVDGGELRVRIRPTSDQPIAAIRAIGAVTLESAVTADDEGGLSATFSVAEFYSGDLALAAVYDGPEDSRPVRAIRVDGKSLLTDSSAERLIITTSHGALRVLDPTASRDFTTRYLDAGVARASVFRQSLELTVSLGSDTNVTGVYFLREVDGDIRRRGFALREATSDGVPASRPIADVVDVRWRVFGTFATPLGTVEAPLAVDDLTEVAETAEYRVRKLASDGVLHPVAREKLRDDELERTPLLSVVMPVYNVGQFLDTAIRSVLTQDLTNLELIIIDDASSDNSRQVIEMHRALDPRIKVIELDHNTLGGAGVPSNLGIRAARGKYLAFVDSDDWVKAGIFSKLVELADQNNAQLVVGDFRTFNDTDRDIVDAYDNAAWRDIPLGEVISAYTHPALLRLSAVPWRKLYRRDLLTENHILYPEGDYFYEDNPLHWFVLSRADRVVATDDVISYHRMEREGQTMGASEYKLGAVTAHANTIFNFLAATEHDGRDLLFEEFFAYLSRVKWTIKRQQQPAAARLIEHRLSHIYKRAVAAAPGVRVPDEIRMQFEEYAGAYPDIDLTVVMPVYNSADLLRSSLDSVLRLSGISFDVLLVDDGSSDDSLKIMREYEQKHANVHAFTQGNRGAGRARNSVIPLVAGRYAFFLDSDDVIDASALEKAVAHADVTGSDLTFVKYQVDYIDEKKVKGMFARDVEAWEKLPLSRTNAERQAFTANMINYPWTRIISTDLLHDANVFFGPTVVHNDVLYHWHSVMAATNIGFYDAIVCSHRKFKERDQVTNIKDARRMAVLEALRGTNKRISDLESYDNGREAWQTFSLKLLDWALDLIPAELRKTYQDHAETLAAEIRD